MTNPTEQRITFKPKKKKINITIIYYISEHVQAQYFHTVLLKLAIHNLGLYLHVIIACKIKI